MQQTAQHNKNYLGFNCVFIFLLIKFSYYRSWVSSMILWSETSWINGMYGASLLSHHQTFYVYFFLLRIRKWGDQFMNNMLCGIEALWDQNLGGEKSNRNISRSILDSWSLILDPWSLSISPLSTQLVLLSRRHPAEMHALCPMFCPAHLRKTALFLLSIRCLPPALIFHTTPRPCWASSGWYVGCFCSVVFACGLIGWCAAAGCFKARGCTVLSFWGASQNR